MAKFRKIHTSFWDDSLIEQFSPEDRYFYLFLMTNPLCTECGIYVLSIKKMVYYTGYNEDAVKCILKRFTDHGRIVYDTSTSEICILKKPNYIDRLGKPVEDCLKSEFSKVKNISLIYRQLAVITRPEVRIVYDTWTISRQEKEKEEEVEYIKRELENLGEKKNKNEEQMIVLEMVKAWKVANPDYPFDKNLDYPACLQLAYKIARANGWREVDVINFKEFETVDNWKKIIDFIKNDSFYRNLSLMQLDKQWQGVYQKMKNAKNITYGNNANKSRSDKQTEQHDFLREEKRKALEQLGFSGDMRI